MFLAVIAERCFGFELGPRQWLARVAAFSFVIAGAALMPAPVRTMGAAEARA